MTDSIFISQVKDVMKYKKIDSLKLSVLISTNHGALNAILSERVRMTLHMALKIAHVLNISLDQLMAMDSKRQEMN